MDGNNVIPLHKNQKSNTFDGILKGIREKVVRLNATENILTLDLNSSNVFHINLKKNLINITFDKLPETDLSYSAVLILKQDSYGFRKAIFPENVYWSFGETAVLATKPGYADVITLMTFDGGETYYASHSLANLGK